MGVLVATFPMGNAHFGVEFDDSEGVSMLELLVHREHELSPWLPRLAEARKRMFAGFPYLYVGDDAYEAEYAEGFRLAQGAVIVEARWEGRFAGMATAMPLREDAFILREGDSTLRAAGLDPAELFYLSESLVEPDFRHKGIGHALLERYRDEGRSQGFDKFCLMAVERPDGHPLRPGGAPSPRPFWLDFGFRKLPGLVDFEYPTLQPNGSAAMERNPMAFWTDAAATSNRPSGKV